MEAEYDFSKAKRGPVLPAEPRKTRITIKLDNTVLDWFRKRAHEEGGGSYQALINEALTRHMATTKEPLERTLRRVIREELRRAG